MRRQSEQRSKESLWDVPALGHRPKFTLQEQWCLPWNPQLVFPTASPLLPLIFRILLGRMGYNSSVTLLYSQRIIFSKTFRKSLIAYMAAKGLSNLTALALLMTLLVITPNYGTGTIQTMQFLLVQQSQHTLSPKACETKIITQFKGILQ